MTEPTLKSTFLASQGITDLLCELLGQYAKQADTRETLGDLKIALGAEEFAKFEADLAKLLRQRTAVHAVKEIIARAVQRRVRPRDAQKEFRRPSLAARFD
jgi:hypothetical protein